MLDFSWWRLTRKPRSTAMSIASDDADLAATFGEMITTGWERVSPLLLEGGGPSFTQHQRVHDDGSTDVLTIAGGPEYASARREDAAGDLVWETNGHLRDLLPALKSLPSPGHPDAPAEPIKDLTAEVDRAF